MATIQPVVLPSIHEMFPEHLMHGKPLIPRHRSHAFPTKPYLRATPLPKPLTILPVDLKDLPVPFSARRTSSSNSPITAPRVPPSPSSSRSRSHSPTGSHSVGSAENAEADTPSHDPEEPRRARATRGDRPEARLPAVPETLQPPQQPAHPPQHPHRRDAISVNMRRHLRNHGDSATQVASPSPPMTASVIASPSSPHSPHSEVATPSKGQRWYLRGDSGSPPAGAGATATSPRYSPWISHAESDMRSAH
ncbi:hypothetical protein MIND_00988000 [Mycena indigotica]|uniref:Uncharacterized protein n=1 Tax=Mycena indigotica TaxID=2126181 RepID=A0A8H6SDM5_9AGAR|nr:uncharacterized protein MIND_00988000 [Mycena indigotica]KAF7297538.1 hypothetical protein MIND_00988000 [Mycena indigotica]